MKTKYIDTLIKLLLTYLLTSVYYSTTNAPTVKANGCLSTAKEKKMGHNRTSERRRNKKNGRFRLILAVNSKDKVECLVHTTLY